MGASQSKLSAASSKTQVHSKSIAIFVSKLHKMMKDPVYSKGVTTSSVLEMVDDLAKVYAGYNESIRVPKPVDGIAPVNTIPFVLTDLNSNHKTRQSKPKASVTSRRALSRDISVAGTSNSKSLHNCEESCHIVEEISNMIAELSNVGGDRRYRDVGDIHAVYKDDFN